MAELVIRGYPDTNFMQSTVPVGLTSIDNLTVPSTLIFDIKGGFGASQWIALLFNCLESSQMGFLSLSGYKGNFVLQGTSGCFTNGSPAIISSVKSGSTDWLWLTKPIKMRINIKESTFIIAIPLTHLSRRAYHYRTTITIFQKSRCEKLRQKCFFPFSLLGFRRRF